MKSNTLLPLAIALGASLFVTACNPAPDATPEADPAVVTEPAAVEPAPAPMTEPMTEPMTPAAEAAAPVDSGMTFAAMDKNGDGGITSDEIADTEMLHQHFAVADTNSDGKLSSDEVDAHRADMAANPPGG